MKNGARVLVILFCITLLASGCASICHGSRTSRPKEARNGIDGVMLLGDVFLTGLLGLIIDFANGAIYKTKPEFKDKYPMKPPTEKVIPDKETSS